MFCCLKEEWVITHQPNCFYCGKLGQSEAHPVFHFSSNTQHRSSLLIKCFFPKKRLPAYCRWCLPHTGLVTQAEMSHKGPMFSSSHMKATSLSHYQYILMTVCFHRSPHYLPIHLHSSVELFFAQQSLVACLLFSNFARAAQLRPKWKLFFTHP